MDEISDRDILQYVRDKANDKFYSAEYLSTLQDILGQGLIKYGRSTMINSMKIDFLLKNIDGIQLEQLEALIK
jgi:hypothetical protein